MIRDYYTSNYNGDRMYFDRIYKEIEYMQNVTLESVQD
jgi:hypothetical protein